MAYKSYSDAERTEAMIRLAVNKYDYDKTAEQLGVTARSLRNWEKDFPKKGVPELLERAIERMLMNIPTEWKGNDWSIAIGILMDKWLLVHGQATARTEQRVLGTLETLPDDDRERVIEEAERILAEAASRGADTGA